MVGWKKTLIFGRNTGYLFLEGFRVSPKDDVDDLPTIIADLLLENPLTWNEELIFHCFEDVVAQAILQIPLPLFPRCDSMRWMCSSNWLFSIKSAFHADRGNTMQMVDDRANDIWKIIWFAKMHNRIKTHLWRVIAGVLPTSSTLAKIFYIDDISCPFYEQDSESIVHLFKCSIAKGLWFQRWGLRTNMLQIPSVEDWIPFFLNPNEAFELDSELIDDFILWMAVSMEKIWKARNANFFSKRCQFR